MINYVEVVDMVYFLFVELMGLHYFDEFVQTNYEAEVNRTHAKYARYILQAYVTYFTFCKETCMISI